MKFSFANVRKELKSIQTVQKQIKAYQKADKILKRAADNFRTLDRETKIFIFKKAATASLELSKNLLNSSMVSAYLKTDINVTKNFIMKKLLTKKLELLQQRENLFRKCIDSSNELLRRVGWDIDMS